jgi:hypothetical protein
MPVLEHKQQSDYSLRSVYKFRSRARALGVIDDPFLFLVREAVSSTDLAEPLKSVHSPTKLRLIPGEDIFLYVKRIDNSEIVLSPEIADQMVQPVTYPFFLQQGKAKRLIYPPIALFCMILGTSLSLIFHVSERMTTMIVAMTVALAMLACPLVFASAVRRKWTRRRSLAA